MSDPNPILEILELESDTIPAFPPRLIRQDAH